MPNYEKTKAKLAEYQKAEKSLKKGNPIIVDGVELKPSMRKDDAESDLASVKRMISRLEKQVEGAKRQKMRKGIQTEKGTICFGDGVPRLVADLGLVDSDIGKIVPTGKNGTVSRRDVRVYANAKAAGKLKEYTKKAEARRTGENLVVTPEKEGPTQTEQETEKPLEKLGKDELVAKCQEMNLDHKGVKKTLLKRIKEALTKSKKPEAEKSELVQDLDKEEKEPVNPIA